jgi:autotransporter-associated beta strand protein
MLFKPSFKTQTIGICRVPRLLRFLATAVLILSSSIIEAATYSWNVSSGDWSTPSNWGGTEPTAIDTARIENKGKAVITQSGETCNDLWIADYYSGSVEMTGGTLSVSRWAYVGSMDNGTFTQTGGINTISDTLCLGNASDSKGTYNLGGTGQLFAGSETIGFFNGTGTFAQTSGTNTTAWIQITSQGTFNLSGGTLNLSNGGLDNRGVFNLSNSSAVINASSSIINLHRTTLATAGNATLNVLDAHSLLIVPSGHDPTEYFAHFNNSGSLVHQAGSALSIPLAYSICGAVGTIEDHVNCYGSLAAAPGYSIGLSGGLNVYDAGSVNLGTGSLTVKDATSGISGGSLNADAQYVGYTGAGTFIQTGGTNTISSQLYLGYFDGTNGAYNLSAGQLSTKDEFIGYPGPYIVALPVGTLPQTGGTNTATYIKTGTNGTYTLSGGVLNINGGFDNTGVWDLSNSSAVINMSSSIINLSGTIRTTSQNVTLNIDAHSLLIVPSGHIATEYFANINNSGIVHQSGSALDISSAYSIYGIGTINDHVNCLGALSATSGYALSINGGLNISETGNVNLGSGYLYVNDTISGMSSGSLITSTQRIGSTGTGTFTQTGGTNTNSSKIYLAYNSGCSGTYNLSGSGQLSTSYEYIGMSGMGTFTQTGGSHIISTHLGLGYYTGSSAAYNLNGGTLILKSIGKGDGTASFNFGGGTMQASGAFSATLPMTLTGTGGNANFDTAGRSVTLSGILSGIGGLNKLGSGTLTLSGTNTFTGPINFNGGLINASALNNLGNGTELNFNGGGLQFSGVFDPSVRTMTFLAGGATLDTQTNNITLGNPIGNSGAGGLTKLGTGKLTLNALNSYSGNTTVKGGTLEIAGGIDASGTSLIDIQSGTAVFKTVNVNKTNLNISTAALATFEVVNGANVVGAISGSGITKVDTGASLTAASINQGTLTIGSGATVVIQAIAGGPQGGAITPVPEPNAFILLGVAFIMLWCTWAKKVK